MIPICVHAHDDDVQANPRNKPDKEKMWTFPLENDCWFRVHNSIRAEIRDFKEALSGLGSSRLQPKERTAR